MWRYREKVENNRITAAYIWETSEDYKSDKLCLFVSDPNGIKAEILVITVDYNYDSINLQPDKFDKSVDNCITRKIFNGQRNVAIGLFDDIKHSGFSAAEPSLMAVSNATSIKIASNMRPATDLVSIDNVADMSILSDMQERFENMCFHLVDLVYGGVVSRINGDFYVWEREGIIIDELKQEFFPINPMNMCKFKKHLILKFYDAKVEHAEDVDLEKAKLDFSDTDIEKVKQLRSATTNDKAISDRKSLQQNIDWITSKVRDAILEEYDIKQEETF